MTNPARQDLTERTLLLALELRYEQDVVSARQHARQIAEAFGFDRQDQTRFTTAVSEITRNAYEYAGGGHIEFFVLGTEDNTPQTLLVGVRDGGPGIARLSDVLGGSYVSKTGMGLGIVGAQRLSSRFRIDSAAGQGTRVELEKDLPRRRPGEPPLDVARIVRALARQVPRNPFEEVRLQNQDLMGALNTLQERQTELDQLNRELSDTNRGVMALYAELDEKAQELQRASEMKTRFLSDMSHEFRTPLNSIMGLARLLLENADGPLTAEQEKQVTFIHQSAHQLAEIVNDLLDTAKIESGKVTVQADPFTVEDLFSSLRGLFRPLVGGSGMGPASSVTLHFEDASALAPLVTDEGKVTQILRNFLSNALKFTECGTVRVWASTYRTETLLGSVPSSAVQEWVAFSVADTGIGIAPEETERIFEEFTQIHSTTQWRTKGTGLGLPLCRKLAGLLGGQVRVESRLGEGSTFTLLLPARLPLPEAVSDAEASGDGVASHD